MKWRAFRRPDRHWLLLAGALMLSSATVWGLLAPEELPDEPMPAQYLTKLKLAPMGAAIALLEKPLFTKTRAPVELAAEGGMLGETGGGEILPAPPAPPLQLPTLVGIATGRGKAIAILKGLDGAARNLSVGDSIDGWTVLAINKARTKISAAGVTHNISLDYTNKQTTGAAPALAVNVVPERGN